MAERSFEEHDADGRKDAPDVKTGQQGAGDIEEGDKQVAEQSRFSPDTLPIGQETMQTAADKKEARFDGDRTDAKPAGSNGGTSKGKKDLLRGLLNRIAFWKKPEKSAQGPDAN